MIGELTSRPDAPDPDDMQDRLGPRVLLVLTQADFRSNGGAISGSELAIQASVAGADVTVLTSHDGPVTERMRRRGLEVEVVESLRAPPRGRSLHALRERFASFVTMHRKLTAILDRNRHDIVQANDRRAFWLSVLPALLHRRPLIDVIRDTQDDLGFLRWLKWRIEIRLAARAVVLSQDMARRWSSALSVPDGEFGVVRSIVQLDHFRPLPPDERARLREQLGIPLSQKVVLYPAGFRPKKQQRRFIERCLPRFFESNETAHLYFVGDFNPNADSYSRSCRDAATAGGLDHRITFAGHRTDIERWYQVADLTVLATEKEGMARGMIESIATGTPVVSFDVASAAEILEGNGCGIVVQGGDYEALASTLARLVDDDAALGGMADRGRRAAEQLFSAESIARDYVKLLEDLTPARDGPAS